MYAKHEDTIEQSRILRQLKDMFSSMPHWRLREVCKESNWDLGSCIDQLTGVSPTYDIKDIKIPQQQQQERSKENKKDVGKGNFNKEEERIGSLIKKGYRVMILMRGPPGTGKSYLARSLVSSFVELENSTYNIEDFVCSSDDYFYNAKGVYKYNSAFISNAHDFNIQRVGDKAKSGLSPIIVDNTNLQLWEMLPYVKLAVQNNYLIEILEPKTPWRNSISALAQKNKHGVPQSRIQQMMEKYEKGTVSSLTRMLKNTKYTKTLPQMRLLPPLNTVPINSQAMQTVDSSSCKEESLQNEQTQVWGAIGTIEPKQQRTKFKSNRSSPKRFEEQDCPSSSKRNVYSLLEQKATNAWKPFELESMDFWGNKQTSSQEQKFLETNDPCKNACVEKSLIDFLREDSADASNELHKLQHNTNEKSTFERHSINCPNESTAFASLRQIYPNKRVSGLWDLFVKCNGDIDWAVDILLKEDELERIHRDDDIIFQLEDDELFECSCNNNGKTIPNQHKSNTQIDADNSSPRENIKTDAKPQRQKSRFSRSNQQANPALLEVKENIENCFVFGDDQYSEHLLKIRNIRTWASDVSGSSNMMEKNNAKNQNLDENPLIEIEDDGANIENEDDDAEGDSESHDFTEDMLEMTLGEQLIEQLVDTFRKESPIEEQISSAFPVNLKVFMPRSLAKQLYMLWVESAFNHLEEERQKLIREDEDFARLLKNPKYSDFKQSPRNLQEILDMEYALKIYNQEKKEQQERDIDMEKPHTPTDLASHLTQMKLCEAFPNIPCETLLDVLAANGNNYIKTVEVLQSTIQVDDVHTTQKDAMECAAREQDLLNQQVRYQIDKCQDRIHNSWDENEQKSSLSPEEAKRLALREFEESRNLAAHHCQLKAECYQKAKEAIQSGNSGAAIYYSQIANLHISKIDMYNHRAANCIMEVHKNTQNNPDLLDLHYLHLIEALGCLDLFLDRHITGLRVASRNYKHVFIITGRGKHSAGGVSTIKNKVKARLKERCLRWSEVNPGLLKVKIFSGSRHSKNI